MAIIKTTFKKKYGNEIKDVYPRTSSDMVIHGNSTISAEIDNKIDISALGQSNGVATLDSNGKINTSQLPSGIGGGSIEWQTLS